MEFVSSFLGYARKAEMYGRKPKCVKTKRPHAAASHLK